MHKLCFGDLAQSQLHHVPIICIPYVLEAWPNYCLTTFLIYHDTFLYFKKTLILFCETYFLIILKSLQIYHHPES